MVNRCKCSIALTVRQCQLHWSLPHWCRQLLTDRHGARCVCLLPSQVAATIILAASLFVSFWFPGFIRDVRGRVCVASRCVNCRITTRGLWQKIAESVIMTPGTVGYNSWVNDNVPGATPRYYNMYFFNITNPHEVLKGKKAKLNQVGPFEYRQLTDNLFPTWSEDENVLTYYPWQWYDDMTNGADQVVRGGGGCSRGCLVTRELGWLAAHAEEHHHTEHSAEGHLGGASVRRRWGVSTLGDRARVRVGWLQAHRHHVYHAVSPRTSVHCGRGEFVAPHAMQHHVQELLFGYSDKFLSSLSKNSSFPGALTPGSFACHVGWVT